MRRDSEWVIRGDASKHYPQKVAKMASAPRSISSRFVELREVFHLVWAQADRFVRARLAAVLAMVIIASIITALGPVALKLVVDGFTGQAEGIPVAPFLLIGLYVLSQWLARTLGPPRRLPYPPPPPPTSSTF